jgi:tetratricopeptide (TPR) repeat protein
MGIVRQAISVLGICLAGLAACAQAQSPPAAATPASVSGAAATPSPPIEPRAMDYSTAPAPWVGFLMKARVADAIADPLQRCLAYPVLPGTNWPAGLIEAHCNYSLGLRPGRKEIFAKIDAGDVDWLDRTFREYLGRHFSESNFSENIHDLFDSFFSDYESGRASQRWLELAPDSPFAMTARANFYAALGWEARGEALISDTPPEQIQQMQAHHAKALALYQEAIAKEPRLLPAYVGLVKLGKNDAELGNTAFAAARKIDPACKVLLSDRMTALQPRWGGSYEQMLALEQEMLPYLEKRPLLALSRVWPYIDMAANLSREKRYDEAAAVLRPMLAVSSSPQVQEDYFLALASSSHPESWSLLSYGVAAKRFRLGRASVAGYRGLLEYSVPHDYELAARDYAAALELEPAKAVLHYYYGQALAKLKKLEDAHREFALAMHYDPTKGTVYQDAAAEARALEASLRAKQ